MWVVIATVILTVSTVHALRATVSGHVGPTSLPYSKAFMCISAIQALYVGATLVVLGPPDFISWTLLFRTMVVPSALAAAATGWLASRSRRAWPVWQIFAVGWFLLVLLLSLMAAVTVAGI